MKKKNLANSFLKWFVRLGLVMVILFTITPVYKIRVYNANKHKIAIENFENKFKLNDSNKSNDIAKGLLEVKGVLYVPEINVKLPIYDNVSENALVNGVGEIDDFGRNKVLTSHNGLADNVLLMNIKDLKLNDKFYVKDSKNQIKEYKVMTNQAVSPTDEIDFLKKFNDKDYVTLRTCSIDGAKRIQVVGENVKFNGIMEKSKFKISLYEIIMILIAIIALILLVLSFVSKKGKKNECRNDEKN